MRVIANSGTFRRRIRIRGITTGSAHRRRALHSVYSRKNEVTNKGTDSPELTSAANWLIAKHVAASSPEGAAADYSERSVRSRTRRARHLEKSAFSILGLERSADAWLLPGVSTPLRLYQLRRAL